MKKHISSFLLYGFFIMALALSGCSSKDVENATKQLEDFNDAIKNGGLDELKDPESIVEYLKKQNEVLEEPEEVEEEEEIVNVYYNVSQLGYMPDGDRFAIKVDTETREPQYSLVSADEAKEAGAVVSTKPNLYGNAVVEYIDNIENLCKEREIDESFVKEIIMYEADALLYLEYYKEGRHVQKITDTANRLADIIYSFTDKMSDEPDENLLYNSSAILSKAAYLLETDDEKEWGKKAVELWEKAEIQSYDSKNSNGSRVWAAAELYRVTKQKTYRTVVEALSEKENIHGITFDNPGYYGMFAYLSSEENTDYKVSGKMMDYFFHDINTKIKEGKKGLLETSLDPDNMVNGIPSEAFINRIVDDCKLGLMANYISVSVEYTDFAKNRVTYLTGANITGIDYLDKDHMSDYDPMLFVYCVLSQN